ncbi:MAG: peptidase [Planctomycetaceae bacterium]
MTRDRTVICGLMLLAAMADGTFAQSRDPHLGYAYPAGGHRGETIEITVGGQYIRDANEVYLSGEGVLGRVVKWYRPLTRGEYQDLRQRLDEEREFIASERLAKRNQEPITLEEVASRAGVTEDQLREMEIYRQRDADPKRQPNEQLVEEVTLQISIAANALPGVRELRLLTPTSMSNPVWFQVDQWPGIRETEPNDPDPNLMTEVQLPVVINGQVFPGDVDRFAISAKKGTRLVVQASVRALMPYLADAVPGWFQAVLTLSDRSGNELAYSDSFHFRQDPVLYFEIPEDGEYVISIHDSIYRGREDFVYRLAIGEIPCITSTFPLGGQLNTGVAVQLQGWNLPQSEVRLHPGKARRNLAQWFPISDESAANASVLKVPLYVDRSKDYFDQEPNDSRQNAQVIPETAVINGRIDKPGDVDVFRFEGSGRLAVHVLARRAGSPLDSVVTIWDDTGNEIAFNDDLEDRSQALATHHADSHLTVNLPGNGAYFVQLADAQRSGGSEFVYRMNVTVPHPDYELRVTPATIIARPGAITPITVHALRTDGFNEEIHLSLIDPPAGLQLDGAIIPEGADQVQCTLRIPGQPNERLTQLELQGTATVKGIRRTEIAVPAENMMQAFIWYHLVPADEWNIIVSGSPAGRPPIDFPTLDPARSRVLPRLKLPAGQSTSLPARIIDKRVAAQDVRLELRDPPPGVSIEKVEARSDVVEVAFQVDPEKAQVGRSGNLILQAFSETTPPPTEENTSPEPQRRFLSYLPALPYEVTKGRGR